MRPRASWTAKTAALTLTAGLVATASGLPGVALAASGSPALTARGGAAGTGQVAGQAALAGDVCGDAGALLGIVGAACRNAALVGSPAAAPTGRGPSQGAAPGTAPGTTKNLGTTVGQVAQRAVAPVTAVLGPGGPVPVLKTVPALAPVTAVTGALSWSRVDGAAGPAAPGTDRTPGNAPATHAGDTNVPAAPQLAGLGALPGLADLPSAGPASAPARHGAHPMPGTALSAASSGMSSGSFAALVVGALLAGVSALKIAGRRARDRKAGIGATQPR